MSALRGDFIGFTIDGIHSSDLGLMRISEGDRYEANLSPTFSDRTSHIQGSDETYYFGTDYTSLTHKLSVAFDSISEKQIRRIKQIFSSKKIMKLIYDEIPYKYYLVKSAAPPSLKYLCFDNENGERVYKGEGNIELISYYPFAKSRFKFLEDYQLTNNVSDLYVNIPEWQKNETNLDEWIGSSGIRSKYVLDDNDVSRTIDVAYTNSSNGRSVYLFNPGDKETPVDIIIQRHGSNYFYFSLYDVASSSYVLTLNNGAGVPPKRGLDDYIRIKTKEGVIVGLNSNKKETGTIYNEYLTYSSTTPSGLLLEVTESPKLYNIQPQYNLYTNYEFVYDYIYY